MAKSSSFGSRDQRRDFDGLLNNLQDWELSFKEKEKKLRTDSIGKGKLDSGKANAKVSTERTSFSTNTSGTQQYDYLKEYEALSQLSSGAVSQEIYVDATSEKELGNEFFKQKKFIEAIDCYSRSIALSPTAVAYANRAMAYIKIKRFQEAENDCTEALNLDDRYIKAYSRRSTARKELRKLKESMDDAEFALRLEPQNQEIKRQYAESRSLLDKEILKKASGALTSSVEGARQGKPLVDNNQHVQQLESVSSSSRAGRVPIMMEDDPKVSNREVAEGEIKSCSMIINLSDPSTGSETTKTKPKFGKQELKASVQELAAKATNLANAEAEKNIVPPTSAYQFEVSWRGLSSDRDLQARLLKVTQPSALPGIFKNALSASILVDIIKCIATFFLEDMSLGVDYLQNLVKIPRFDTIIMCMSPADKDDVVKIWNEVFSKSTAGYANILFDLRPRYGVKQ